MFIFSDPVEDADNEYDSVRVVRGDELLMSLQGSDYGPRVWISHENLEEEITLDGTVYKALLVGV